MCLRPIVTTLASAYGKKVHNNGKEIMHMLNVPSEELTHLKHLYYPTSP